ncbi:Arylesterase [Thalassovita gelatinovora]|uniref:Arylesterase n=1 Tax=Thalassovita gelatinovora TaxID=53501 RepID=A0A0P1FCF7_THAGE|nr:alpha/beta hydrolase [Thalassovita gelatinovora]QIZ80436.1 alpha/beta hydrolase [Thalassovita gelatinovora]CUH65829.1 Arylesterase [Thalassovita gelatinovora]SEQ72436.1 Pimeloyl-ACP methyl ester carboxylesterase [Thalassovita gelatinovora]
MPKFTTSDGLSLHYEDQGQGLPVLCLSGLTRNARDFDFVAPQLAGYRMIRLDYRGRGQSDWAEDYLSYNVPRESKDVLELLDHLGIDKAAIIGTSRGGLIAMGLAAVAKDRLLGVCLNDIGPVLETGGLDYIMGHLGQHPEFKTFDEAAAARKQAMEPLFPGVPLNRWRKEVTHTHVETPEGVRLNYDPKLRDAVIEAGATGTADLWPYFDAIAPLPCAIIHGGNSDLLSFETVAGMKRRNPNLVVAHVPDRAHIPFLDEAEAQVALSDWLEKLKQA